jgi:sporulation protein YlmC with PRC-barrel domain
MQKQENTSSLPGMVVIAEKEGAFLGNVSRVFVDTETRQMRGIAFKTRRVFGSLAFVPVSSILKVGRDVVTVQAETDAHDVTDSSPAPGVDLKSMQGHWVTTSTGKHLGRLADLDFEPTTWSITAICLDDGGSLPVTPNDVTFGSDEVIVPAAIAPNLKISQETQGVLTRMLGHETGHKVVETVQKAVKKMRLTKDESSLTPPDSGRAP